MAKSIEIFCCYAHEDQPLLRKLLAHLMPLQRQGLITIWSDRDINAGSDWKQAINEHLLTAQIILLLMSPDFMASEYCYSKELAQALALHERGAARVIPIILRPIYWQNTPFGKLRALPTNGYPVTGRNWHTQDEAFVAVAQGIHEVVKLLITEPGASSWVSHQSDQFPALLYPPQQHMPQSVSSEMSSPRLASSLSPSQSPPYSFPSTQPTSFPRRPLSSTNQQLVNRGKQSKYITIIAALLVALIAVSTWSLFRPPMSNATSQNTGGNTATGKPDAGKTATIAITHVPTPTPGFVSDGTITKNLKLTCTNCDNPIKITIKTIAIDSSKERMVWSLSTYNSSAVHMGYIIQTFSLTPSGTNNDIKGTVSMTGDTTFVPSGTTQEGSVVFSFLPRVGDSYALNVEYTTSCIGCVLGDVQLDPVNLSF